MAKTEKPKFEKKTQAQLYKEAAQIIIDSIKDGTAPWMKPWDAESAAAFMRPHSAITGKPYLGINVVLLMSRRHSDPRWMTFKQAKEKGWNVRKGEKSTPIYFYKPHEIETDEVDSNGKKVKKTIPVLKSYAMFNASQIDGVPELSAAPKGFEAVDAAEEIISDCGTKFQYGGDALTYNVNTDTVLMPPKRSFIDHNYFYAAAMHGAALGTAHPTRLNRKTAEFVDDPVLCAQEQMRVEIAAMILSADLGLAHDPANHVAYVAQWIEILEKDPKELFRAARDAEAIRNHLMGFFKPENAVNLVIEDDKPAAQEAAPEEQAPTAVEQEAATPSAEPAAEKPAVQTSEDDDVLGAFDLGMGAPTPAIQDEVENLIFNGNATDVINDVKEATGKVDSGLDLGDLDDILGLSKPASRSPGMSF